MSQKNQTNLTNRSTLDDDYLYTASSADMTGLVPNGGHNDYELENFNELYPYLPNTTQVAPNTPVAELTFKEKNLKNKRSYNNKNTSRDARGVLFILN